jgi:tetratricopeptide (TPR) repeat protein
MIVPAAVVICLMTPTYSAGYAPRADLEAGRYLKALADAEAQLRVNPNQGIALAAKSQALTSLQRFYEALAVAEKAVNASPGLADAYLARGQARAGTAVQQRNLGSLRKASGAMDDFETATKMDPSFTMAWMSLGLAYEQLPGILGGSTRKALACAESLRKVNPAKGDVLQGTILAMEGRWKEAEPYFGRALATAPGDPDVVYTYLSEGLGRRETEKALGSAEQKRRLASEARRLLPLVRNRARGVEAASLAFMDAGQPEEAWKVAQEALPHVDAPSLLRLHLGKLADRTGLHRQEGLAYLDKVLREPLEGGSGGYPAAHWRKGQILKDLGRNVEAKAEAQAALRMDPKHPGAKKLMEELD